MSLDRLHCECQSLSPLSLCVSLLSLATFLLWWCSINCAVSLCDYIWCFNCCWHYIQVTDFFLLKIVSIPHYNQSEAADWGVDTILPLQGALKRECANHRSMRYTCLRWKAFATFVLIARLTAHMPHTCTRLWSLTHSLSRLTIYDILLTLSSNNHTFTSHLTCWTCKCQLNKAQKL